MENKTLETPINENIALAALNYGAHYKDANLLDMEASKEKAIRTNDICTAFSDGAQYGFNLQNKPLTQNEVDYIVSFMKECNIAEGGENQIYFRDGFQLGVNYRDAHSQALIKENNELKERLKYFEPPVKP